MGGLGHINQYDVRVTNSRGSVMVETHPESNRKYYIPGSNKIL